MRAMILDEPEFRRWREQADSAAEAAGLAAAGGRFDWSCFLSEQAAQLAVKGLLHGLGAEAWGHDVLVLVRRAVGLVGDALPADLERPAARLARHYIPSRYPDAHPSGAPASHYTAGDAETAAADARSLVDAVDEAWEALEKASGDKGAAPPGGEVRDL
jgi:HEPN domain-containing protein